MKKFLKLILNKLEQSKILDIVSYILVFALLTLFIGVLITANTNGGKGANGSIKEDGIKDVSYLEFNKMLEGKKIDTVDLRDDMNIFYFKDKEGQLYSTSDPKTDNFREKLLLEGVRLEESNFIKKDNQNNKGISSTIKGAVSIVINMFILFLLFRALTSSSGNSAGSANSFVSDTKVDTKSENKNKPITLADVEGLSEVKEDIGLIIESLKNPMKFKEIGARSPKGVVLYGPPGTGKTLTAKAIAGEAGVPFFQVSGSEFVEMYVGVGAKRIRSLYKDAKKNAPCIIFIDEIDAVGKKRSNSSSSNDERDQTLNQLLTELDGFTGAEGIVTIAATNRLDILDPALIREGRFDKHLAIPLPDKIARKNILTLHAKSKRVADDVDMDKLSSMTSGFSGAALETLLNEAALLAVLNNRKAISNEDIDNAYYKVILKGNIKTSTQEHRSKEELELVAWHEAGHALMGKLLNNDVIPKVTILSTTSGAGGFTVNEKNEDMLPSKKMLENEIKKLYGGRAAEEILYNGDSSLVTIGASNDIEKATSLIKSYISHYGMTDEFALVNMDVLFGEMASQIGASENILNASVDISKRLYKETKVTLTDNYNILKEIAEELMDKETLDNDDIDKILDKYKE